MMRQLTRVIWTCFKQKKTRAIWTNCKIRKSTSYGLLHFKGVISCLPLCSHPSFNGIWSSCKLIIRRKIYGTVVYPPQMTGHFALNRACNMTAANQQIIICIILNLTSALVRCVVIRPLPLPTLRQSISHSKSNVILNRHQTQIPEHKNAEQNTEGLMQQLRRFKPCQATLQTSYRAQRVHLKSRGTVLSIVIQKFDPW